MIRPLEGEEREGGGVEDLFLLSPPQDLTVSHYLEEGDGLWGQRRRTSSSFHVREIGCSFFFFFFFFQGRRERREKRDSEGGQEKHGGVITIYKYLLIEKKKEKKKLYMGGLFSKG